MGNCTVYGKVHILVGTEGGAGRGVGQHRRRLSGELNINLKPRPLDSAVALFKKNLVVSRKLSNGCYSYHCV